MSASIFNPPAPPPPARDIPDGLRRADRTDWVVRGVQPKALPGLVAMGSPAWDPDSPSPAALCPWCLGHKSFAAGAPASTVTARGPRSQSPQGVEGSAGPLPGVCHFRAQLSDQAWGTRDKQAREVPAQAGSRRRRVHIAPVAGPPQVQCRTSAICPGSGASPPPPPWPGSVCGSQLALPCASAAQPFCPRDSRGQHLARASDGPLA